MRSLLQTENRACHECVCEREREREREKIAFGNREEIDGKIKCKEREENMFRIY